MNETGFDQVMDDPTITTRSDLGAGDGDHRLPDTAAQRALREAKARRLAAEGSLPKAEIDGRGGLDPVRYGDWEVKGLASDF